MGKMLDSATGELVDEMVRQFLAERREDAQCEQRVEDEAAPPALVDDDL